MGMHDPLFSTDCSVTKYNNIQLARNKLFNFCELQTWRCSALISKYNLFWLRISTFSSALRLHVDSTKEINMT